MQYDKNGALLQSEAPTLKLINRGKVRDIYDLGDSLLFVATDRLSAFDVVMPNGIPNKGKVLTQISLFWFEYLTGIPNHIITTDLSTIEVLKPYVKDLQDRSIVVKKAKVLPVECIVRGYLVGSGWKDYQKMKPMSAIPAMMNIAMPSARERYIPPSPAAMLANSTASTMTSASLMFFAVCSIRIVFVILHLTLCFSSRRWR